MLNKLKEARITLNPEECEFSKTSIKIQGHVVVLGFNGTMCSLFLLMTLVGVCTKYDLRLSAGINVICIAEFSKIDTKKARLYRSSNSNRLSEHI